MKSILGLLLIFRIICMLAFTTHIPYKLKIFTVVIGVSHGWSYSVDTFNQVSEKEIVLENSQLIKEKIVNENIKIKFTRQSYTAIGLPESVAHINQVKPDLVHSLHIASHSERSVSGIEIFVAEKCKSYKKSYIPAENLKKRFDSMNTDLVARIKKAHFLLIKK